MNDEFFALLMAEEDEEESAFQAYRQQAVASLGLVGHGILESRRVRRERRHISRHYLRRADLLPNPRHRTAWQQLYENQSDMGFLTVFAIDVAAFHFLLDSGFAALWLAQNIPRADTNTNSVPRTERRSLDSAGAYRASSRTSAHRKKADKAGLPKSGMKPPKFGSRGSKI